MRWIPAHAAAHHLKIDAAAYASLCPSLYGSEPVEQAAKRQEQQAQEAWEEMWMPKAVPAVPTSSLERGLLASAASVAHVVP